MPPCRAAAAHALSLPRRDHREPLMLMLSVAADISLFDDHHHATLFAGVMLFDAAAPCFVTPASVLPLLRAFYAPPHAILLLFVLLLFIEIRCYALRRRAVMLFFLPFRAA